MFGRHEEICRFCSGFSLNLTAAYFPHAATSLFSLPLSGINAVSSLIPQVSGRNVEKTGCHFPNQGIIYPAATAAGVLKKAKAHLQSWEVQCLRSSSEMMLFRAGGADFPPAPLSWVMFNQHLCFELPHFLIIMMVGSWKDTYWRCLQFKAFLVIINLEHFYCSAYWGPFESEGCLIQRLHLQILKHQV